jgi:DNA-binding GntR family transcriptional regulator
VQIFTETLLTVADSGVDELQHSKSFRKTAVQGHDEIIAAFEAKDPDRVEQAMRAHVSAGKKGRISENRDLMSRSLRWVQ